MILLFEGCRSVDEVHDPEQDHKIRGKRQVKDARPDIDPLEHLLPRDHAKSNIDTCSQCKDHQESDEVEVEEEIVAKEPGRELSGGN